MGHTVEIDLVLPDGHAQPTVAWLDLQQFNPHEPGIGVLAHFGEQLLTNLLVHDEAPIL